MANEQFVYKPKSDHGGLAVLIPSSVSGQGYGVRLVDAEGNVISEGNFREATNGGRDTYDFDKPGNAYGSQVFVQVVDNGGNDVFTYDVGGGGTRYVGNGFGDLRADPGGAGHIGGSGGSGTEFQGGGGEPSSTTYGAPNINQSAGGSQFVDRRFVDFGGVPTPYVDFPSSLNQAQAAGAEARDVFFSNIDRSKDPALGLVDTDIAGIQKGLDAFIPQIRAQGDIDTQTNIGRAAQIDEFNFSRLPEFNARNQEARNAAIDATGLNTRERFTGVLDRLEERAQGNLPGELGAQLDRDLANRGSDLLRASGISSLSGAGIRANQRLTIQERLNLALNADAQLPGVLTGAQQLLEAPTLFAQPTQVPLNATNLAERIPLTSNISAGAAQQGLATNATSLEAIPGTTALQGILNTAQFNENAKFEREKFVLGAQQDQLTAADASYQGAINADTATQIRNETRSLRQTDQAITGGAALLGAVPGIVGAFTSDGPQQQGGTTTQQQAPAQNQTPFQLDSSGNMVPVPAPGVIATGSSAGASGPISGPTGVATGQGGAGFGERVVNAVGAMFPSVTSGAVFENGDPTQPANIPFLKGGTVRGEQRRGANPIADMVISGAGDVLSTVASGAGAVATGAVNAINNTFGENKDGAVRVGDKVVSANEMKNFFSGVGSFIGGTDTDTLAPQMVNGQPVATSYTDANTGQSTYVLQDGSEVTQAQADASGGVTGVFRDMMQPLSDAGVDAKVVGSAAQTMANWNNMSPQDQAFASSDSAIQIAENKGIIGSERAADIRQATNGLSTIMNPNSTAVERAAATAAITTELSTRNFTGTIDAPTSIGGSPVVGNAATESGNAGFLLQNGQVVSQQELAAHSGILNTISAFSVLNSDADIENKLAALTSIGVTTAAANDIITQVDAGNLSAGLSIFNFANDFNDRSPVEQAVSFIQTASTINNAINQGGATALSEAGSGALTFLDSGAAGADAVTSFGVTETGEIVASGSEAATGSTLTAVTPYLQGAAGAAGIVLGVIQAANTVEALRGVPRSRGVAQGAIGGAISGAGIGAGIMTMVLPGLGTLAGAAAGAQIGAIAGGVLGAVGTGKGTGQTMRDGWRSGLEQMGMAKVNPETGSHEVTLSNGTSYDIGRDGDAKLENLGVNIDGNTERNTYDVDWSNQVAVDSIPEAHLYALATGLNPTDQEGFGLFDRAVGQSLNAATSNANTIEGVRENFHAMMKDVDPIGLAAKVETLRISNTITDQEYGVYLDKINKVFGTKITPTNRQEALDGIINMINEVPENERGPAQDLLNTLTSEDKLAENQRRLDARLGKEKKNLEESKGLGTLPSKDIAAPIGKAPKREGVDIKDAKNPIGGPLTPEQRDQLAQKFPQLMEMSSNGAFPPGVLESLRVQGA